MTPPVDTPATGQARFHMNANGTLCYYVDVRNITGVVGAHVGLKNGTELASLTNPYAEVATIASYPTAAVDGILIAGEIKAGSRRTSCTTFVSIQFIWPISWKECH